MNMRSKYNKLLVLFLAIIVVGGCLVLHVANVRADSKELPKTTLTGQLWDNHYAFYQKIFTMPFNQELLNGTLDEKVFKNYIIQDYLFLQNFRKVYGILLAKTPDETAMRFIVNMINGVDEEIEYIHNIYCKKLGISHEDILNSFPMPCTEFYNAYLIKTAALEPFEVGLIATLPCHWIYYRIGVDMQGMLTSKANKYQEWIDGYGGESWEESETKHFVDVIEVMLRSANNETGEKMKQAFSTAMKLEYLFWDNIYQGINWVD